MQPKFCTMCGNTLRETDKFCRKCGAPVKQIERKQIPVPGAQPQMQSGSGYAINENPEGTVLLGDIGSIRNTARKVKKADISFSFEEMLRGCSKVVDFGTGKRYELTIPPGLTPGDTIVVEKTGIVDRETGNECVIELTAVIE